MGLFSRLKNKAAEAAKREVPANALVAPVAGKVIAMTEVPDPAFGSEMLGKGCAIWPAAETVASPVAGCVSVVMPHAVGITADNGAEVLVHVGIDTVSMQGDGFTGHVTQGDRVAAGQTLLDFDRAKIEAAGHKDCVVLAVSNSADFAVVALAVDAGSSVAAGDAVLTLAK